MRILRLLELWWGRWLVRRWQREFERQQAETPTMLPNPPISDHVPQWRKELGV